MTAKTKMKLKKGDKVVVITGRDKGKTGEVLKDLAEENRVIVQGVNMVKKHRKPSQAGPGKIEQIESSIHASNVALADPKTGKASKVGYKLLSGGKKTRIARASGETID